MFDQSLALTLFKIKRKCEIFGQRTMQKAGVEKLSALDSRRLTVYGASIAINFIHGHRLT
jgi:hypothetical protein